MAADITLDTLRLFVNERLTAVADDILSVFVRTIFQYQQEIDIQRRQLDSLNLNSEIKPHDVSDFFPVCEKEASPEQQHRRPSLAQKEPKMELELEEILYWPEQGDTLTMTVHDHNRETDEHTKPQADVYEYEYGGASQPSSHVQPLSSHCSDSDTEDSDEWEETTKESFNFNTPKSPETQIAETLPLNNLSRDLKLTPHRRNHRGKTKKRCTHCGKKFNRTATCASIAVHMAIHATEKPFSCNLCGKTYPLKLYLVNHMRWHKKQENLKSKFSCSICGEECTGSDMKEHMITHAGEMAIKKETVSCEVCGKIYARNVNLARHMRTEHASSCTVCGKEFTQSGDLKAHMMTHTPEPFKRKGKKPFSCKVCGKKYARHVHMDRHMETHVKAENASSCTVRGKEFTQSGDLKAHMMTHTEDKHFKCTICGKVFNVKKNLDRHTWTHTREKPFHCTGCGKGYVEMCDLRKHLRRSICGSDYGVQVYATNT